MSKDNGFIVIPNTFIRDEKLSIYEKMLFCVFLTCKGMPEIFLSYETLSKQSGIKRTKLIETIKLLEQKKYIKVVKDGDHKTNIYQLLKKLPVRHTDVAVRHTNPGVRETDGVGSPHEPVPVRHTNPTKEKINNKTLVKEINKEKDLSSKKILDCVIDFLNEVCGTKYKSNTVATMKHINARIKEGFTLEDLKTVVRKRYKEWHGTDSAQYLRPETLFGNKFEGYLNAPDKEKESDDTRRVPNFKPEKEPTPEEIKETREYGRKQIKKLIQALDEKQESTPKKTPIKADISKSMPIIELTPEQRKARQDLLKRQAEQLADNSA